MFQLGSCPLPRFLSQCWSLLMSTLHPPVALGSCLGDQLGWSCVGGVLTAHPETLLCFHNFVWQKCQGWCCSVVGLICHRHPLPEPRWLTGREQVTATPRDSSCLLTLHSQRVLRSGQNLPCTVTLTGDAHEWKKSFLTCTEGTWNQMSRSLLEKATWNEFRHLLQQIAHTYSSQPGFVCLARAWWLVAMRMVVWGSCWGHQAPCPSTCALPKPVALPHAPSGTRPRLCGLGSGETSAVGTNGSVCLLVTLRAFLFPSFQHSCSEAVPIKPGFFSSNTWGVYKGEIGTEKERTIQNATMGGSEEKASQLGCVQQAQRIWCRKNFKLMQIWLQRVAQNDGC